MLTMKKAVAVAVPFLLMSSLALADLSYKAKKAEKLVNSGRIAEAIVIYQDLMSKNAKKKPQFVKEGREGMAKCLLIQAKEALDKSKYADSKDKAETIMADYKDTPSFDEAIGVMVAAHIKIAKGLFSDGQYEECIAQSKEVKKKIPADEKSLRGDVDKVLSVVSNSLLEAADEAIKSKKYKNALELLALAKSSAVDKANAAQCLYKTGLSYRMTKQNKKAITAYREVTDDHADSPFAVKAYADLYLIYAQKGDKKEALESIRQAVGLAPDNSDYLFKEMQAYDGLGKTEKAQRDAKKIIGLLQEEIPKTYINKEKLQYKLGQAHLILGHYTEASVEFNKALARDPDLFEAKRSLALAQFKDKNYVDAIKSYDVLIKALTNEFEEVDQKLSRKKTSIELAKKAERLRKDIAFCHYQKGLSYEQLKEYDKALAETRLGLEGVSTKEAAATQKRIKAAMAAAEAKEKAEAEAKEKEVMEEKEEIE